MSGDIRRSYPERREFPFDQPPRPWKRYKAILYSAPLVVAAAIGAATPAGQRLVGLAYRAESNAVRLQGSYVKNAGIDALRREVAFDQALQRQGIGFLSVGR